VNRECLEVPGMDTLLEGSLMVTWGWTYQDEEKKLEENYTLFGEKNSPLISHRPWRKLGYNCGRADPVEAQMGEQMMLCGHWDTCRHTAYSGCSPWGWGRSRQQAGDGVSCERQAWICVNSRFRRGSGSRFRTSKRILKLGVKSQNNDHCSPNRSQLSGYPPISPSMLPLYIWSE